MYLLKRSYTIVLICFLFTLFMSGCSRTADGGDRETHFSADTNLSETLVGENEEALLTFAADSTPQYASLCREKNNAYIVFRFGTHAALMIEVKDDIENRFNAFTYDYYFRGGGAQNSGIDDNHLSFAFEQYEIDLFDTYSADDDHREVGVTINDVEKNNSKTYYANNSTVVGNLLFFRER